MLECPPITNLQNVNKHLNKIIIKKQSVMTRIYLLCLLLLVLTFNYSLGQTLNFDEPFGTQSWTEDAHPWSWDNTGWDNIRTYQPHTGTGHGMVVN